MRWMIVTGLLTIGLAAGSAAAQGETGRVTGTVTSTDGGAPINGATVTLAGTRLGAVTGSDGAYTIVGVAPGTYTVRVVRLGFAPGTLAGVTVPAGGTATASFTLEARAVVLDQVVSIGYGTANREDVASAITSVPGEDLEVPGSPTVTVSAALQGRAAGVQVITNSGLPGVGTSVRVRGTNSITANSEPLYVIDGVPATQGTNSADPTQNPLTTFNPADIETIDILKDASATAIYGARGANGVVLITTKRGNRGEDRFSLESSYGTQEISKSIDVLNAQQYMELRNEAVLNADTDPSTPYVAPYSAEEIAAAQTYDYQSFLLRDAPQQSHTLGFSGGDVKTRYLLSGNFVDQEGIIVGTDFQRYGGRLNLDRDFSDAFRMGTSMSLARIRHNLSQVENGEIAGNSRGILNAMVYDPSQPVYDAQGNYIRRTVLGEFINNPVATVNELTDQRNETRFLGNVFGELDLGRLAGDRLPLEGLRARTSFGANIWDAFNPFYAPRAIQQGFDVGGAANIWQGRSYEYLNENLLTYNREDVGPGRLDLTGGFSVQVNEYDWNNINAQGFLVEDPKWNNVGSASTRNISSGASEWALLSYLGRANYNLLDRYIFTATARRDGSSRFGANNKWAFFPSAAFAWRISEEAFMQEQTRLDDLKLRLSYGVTGNQAVDPYNSLAQLSSTESAIGGRITIGFAPGSRAPNPNLQWETTKQFNAGVDVGFLDNRVTASLDAYRSRTDDLLLVVNMPFTSGYADQLQNIGSVENTGVELSLQTVNVDRGRFGWRSNFNIAANRNEVVSLGSGREFILVGNDNSRGWSWAVGGTSHIVQPGEPLGSFYGYRVIGLFQEGDDCELTTLRPTLDCVPGELNIEDVDGDGEITADDRTIIGNAQPDFYGGLSNDFSFGPFSVDAFVSFSVGGEALNASNAFLMSSSGQLNERAEVLNRWTPENTNTSIPRANANRRTLVYSTLIEDASYVRLQSLTFGYELPTAFLRGAEMARLYVTGTNLLTFTDYSGFDPEVNSLGGDPRTRGLDVGAYPRARSWNVGLNLTF